MQKLASWTVHVYYHIMQNMQIPVNTYYINKTMCK
jgi:hypothetical protein